MERPPTSKSDVRPLDGSNVKAFLSIRVGAWTFHGCKIVQQSGQAAWLAMPSREYTAQDGSKKYQTLVEIDKKHRQRLSDTVVRLWEAKR